MTIQQYLSIIKSAATEDISVQDLLEKHPPPAYDAFIIQEIEKATGLIFVNEEDVAERVCFANSTELQDDFKSTFNRRDILFFFRGLAYQILKITSQSKAEARPKSLTDFWQTANNLKEGI